MEDCKSNDTTMNLVGKDNTLIFLRSDIWTTNFVQPLCQPLFLYFYWTKSIERERKRERIKKHMNMRERVVQKL